MEGIKDINSLNMPNTDDSVHKFYNKLNDLPYSHWVPVEEKFYKLTTMGFMQFSDTGKFDQMPTPNLSYFYHS